METRKLWVSRLQHAEEAGWPFDQKRLEVSGKWWGLPENSRLRPGGSRRRSLPTSWLASGPPALHRRACPFGRLSSIPQLFLTLAFRDLPRQTLPLFLVPPLLFLALPPASTPFSFPPTSPCSFSWPCPFSWFLLRFSCSSHQPLLLFLALPLFLAPAGPFPFSCSSH